MMTREEAIKYAESKKMMLKAFIWNDDCKYGNYAMYSTELSFVNATLSALRGPTREKVEQVWRGEWEGTPRLGVYYMTCSKCGFCPGMIFYSSDFCPNCGAPMTDEAVDMVMERMEALKDGNQTD